MAREPSVVVVGSVNEDVVLRVPRRPAPGQTLSATAVERRPGGKGANQAMAAAATGPDVVVRLVARVGVDPAGSRMLEDIRAGGVDAEHVTPDEGAATGTAYITVTPDGENTIVLDPGANHRLAPADVDRATPVIEQARVLLSQLEVPIDTVARALAVATGAGVRPVLTLSPAQPVPDDLLAGLDPLLVNQQEAGSLLGRSRVRVREAEEAARSLIKLGPRSVVITLGPDGAILATASGESRLAVEGEAQVVDTTGAGDALAGAMAAALARGLPLVEAVKAGMRVAALAVGRRGAR